MFHFAIQFSFSPLNFLHEGVQHLIFRTIFNNLKWAWTLNSKLNIQSKCRKTDFDRKNVLCLFSLHVSVKNLLTFNITIIFGVVFLGFTHFFSQKRENGFINSQQIYVKLHFEHFFFNLKKLIAKIYCTFIIINLASPYVIAMAFNQCSNISASLIFTQWWQTNPNEHYAKSAGPTAIIKSSTHTKPV